jgi:hypothetical protein
LPFVLELAGWRVASARLALRRMVRRDLESMVAVVRMLLMSFR